MRTLYARWQVIVHEVAKFGIVGAINTVIDFGIFNLLRAGFDVGPLTSSAVALTIAATSSYFMNRHWTFRHRARSGLGREYSLFFMLNGIGLGLQLSCIAISHYGLDLDSLLADNIAKAVGLVIGTIFRFTTYKRWVFMSAERAAARATVEGSVAELSDEDFPDDQAGNGSAPHAQAGDVQYASTSGNGQGPAHTDEGPAREDDGARARPRRRARLRQEAGERS
jgi:putative flippase GtrA